MKEKQTLAELRTIVNLQRPDYDNSLYDSLCQSKIKFRRDRVNRLKIAGCTNEEIAEKIGSSISTVEKDLQEIRELSVKWYEHESIYDFCESLYDSIILCDIAIKDLQILYSECTDLQSKLQILSMISNFEERKIELYSKTKAVKTFLGAK